MRRNNADTRAHIRKANKIFVLFHYQNLHLWNAAAKLHDGRYVRADNPNSQDNLLSTLPRMQI